MIILIGMLITAIVFVLCSFALWIVQCTRYRHQQAESFRATNAYLAELRRRQLAGSTPQGSDSNGAGVVLQFPHPPGVA